MAFEQIKKVVSNLVPKTTSILVPETSQDTIEPAVQSVILPDLQGTESTAIEQNGTATIPDEPKQTSTVSTSTETVPQSLKRKIISLSRIGTDHIYAGKNNQDYKLCGPNMKFVFDGCGSGTSSEVGSRHFTQLFMQEGTELMKNGETIGEENFEEIVKKVFERMTVISKEPSFLFNNYCFTILACFETDTEYVVLSCGDGFIILDDGKNISFQQLDDGEYPKYYIYNYIEDKEVLKEYKEGVGFTVNRFSKKAYQVVGVATDGLRFYSELSEQDQVKFARSLHAGSSGQIERIINLCNEDRTLLFNLQRYYKKLKTEEERQLFLRHVPQLKTVEERSQAKFRDDVTICF